MRLSFNKSTAVLLLLVIAATTTTYAWDKEEHRLLADSVFSAVMRECRSDSSADGLPLDPHGFAQRVAQLAANDLDPARFHDRGQSIMDQLSALTTESLGVIDSAQLPTPPGNNVVASFLRSHLRALRLAFREGKPATTDSFALASALNEEALAQGYLADAFAAGHILSYNELPLSFLHKRNREEAHNYHRDRGVYVINGRGDVWQTFGDGLLHWYPPTYKAVFDACAASLREVLIVWFTTTSWGNPGDVAAWLWLNCRQTGRSEEEVVGWWLAEHSGQEYYRDVQLPSLLYFPMPITATWSYRTLEADEHGVRRRHHYPQLRETGFHDPDLSDIDDAFLYSHESVPEWMIPEPLQAASSVSAHELIKSDPDWASVRFVQNRHAPPSYRGLLLQAGGQVTIREGHTRGGMSFGLGYGIWDDLLLIKNVSIAATFLPAFCESNHHLLTSTLGLGIDLPGDGLIGTLRLEGGTAIGLSKDFNDFGPVFALGVDSRVMPLRFTYAGITWRLKYQWFSLDTPVSGPSIEMVLQ